MAGVLPQTPLESLVAYGAPQSPHPLAGFGGHIILRRGDGREGNDRERMGKEKKKGVRGR